jgi:hypothetical protein
MKTKTNPRQALLSRLQNPRNRLVRCYDNGGTEAGGSFDRYTVAYLNPEPFEGRRWYSYVGMSTYPFDPQGFGCHAQTDGAPVDYPVARMGRRNHLGKRIPFADLPPDCQRLVLQDLSH